MKSLSFFTSHRKISHYTLVMTFFKTLSSISIITLPGLILSTATQSLASPYIRIDNALVFKSLRFIMQTFSRITFSWEIPMIPKRLAIIILPRHTKTFQMHHPQAKYNHLYSPQDCIPTRMRRLETFASFCNAQGC